MNIEKRIKMYAITRDINRLTTVISTLDFMQGNSSDYLSIEWLESTLYTCKNARELLRKALRELEEVNENDDVHM